MEDSGTRGRASWRRWVLRVVVVLLGLLAVAVVVWVARLPEAEPAPLAAVLEDPALTVTRSDEVVTLEPAAGAGGTTVVFYPGAGVPPEAYLATWAPVVRSTGVRVLLPTMPLRLAVLDADAAEPVRAAADDGTTDTWWLGGHSLGGAMAASHLAGTQVGDWAGLVLWAAYPAGEGLADRDDLRVVSVAGAQDGLTTPEEVAASREDLPADATIAVLDGVNHAQFGAYGDQRGDGAATVTDDVARAAIAAETAAALTSG